MPSSQQFAGIIIAKFAALNVHREHIIKEPSSRKTHMFCWGLWILLRLNEMNCFRRDDASYICV